MKSPALYLREDLADAWAGCDPFDVVAGLDGELFRAAPGRRTFRCRIGDRHYFVKEHTGVGWREIFKNVLVLRRPIVDARNEFEALEHLRRYAVCTPQVAGFGVRGISPAHRHSFVVTDPVDHQISIAQLVERWIEAPPEPQLRRRLITAVADLTRRLHSAGVNHRDYYLDHMLVDPDELVAVPIAVTLIDLHRARVRQRVPRRWQIRDLAALLYSSLDANLSRWELRRFAASYTQSSARRALELDRVDWSSVIARAEKLYRKATPRGLVKGEHDTDLS